MRPRRADGIGCAREMFGAASYLQALPGLLDDAVGRRRSRVRNGTGRGGTGAVCGAASIAVDRSGDMLQAARRRLQELRQRRRPAGRARGAAARYGVARRRDAAPRAASRARSGRCAARGGTRAAAGRTPPDLRHAAARSRGVSSADGARVARVRRRAAAQAARAAQDSRRSGSRTLAADPAAKGPALFVASGDQRRSR